MLCGDLVHGHGFARAFSGAELRKLATWRDIGDDDRFGTAAGQVEDSDGDGCAEVVIGAPRDDSFEHDAGAVRIYSGKTHGLLVSSFGECEDDRSGTAVCGLGDANEDGTPDVAACASDARTIPWRHDARTRPAYVRIDSGKDGSTLTVFRGRHSGDSFGFSISAIADLDGDGSRDLAIGDPSAGNEHSGLCTGRIILASSRTADIRGELTLSSETCLCNERDACGPWRWGASLSGAAGFDADGARDVLMGASDSCESGRAIVFSGRTGKVIHVYDAGRLGGNGTGPSHR